MIISLDIVLSKVFRKNKITDQSRSDGRCKEANEFHQDSGALSKFKFTSASKKRESVLYRRKERGVSLSTSQALCIWVSFTSQELMLCKMHKPLADWLREIIHLSHDLKNDR